LADRTIAARAFAHHPHNRDRLPESHALQPRRNGHVTPRVGCHSPPTVHKRARRSCLIHPPSRRTRSRTAAVTSRTALQRDAREKINVSAAPLTA